MISQMKFTRLLKNFRQNRSQRGSALFIILIAVVLFAALSYAVSQMLSSGAGTGTVTDEKARLQASEILDYTRSLRQAVQNIKIAGECASNKISFENSTVTGYAHTPATDDVCKIFGADGGAMTYIAPAEDWLDMSLAAPTFRGEWYFPPNVCVPGIGSAPAGNACASNATTDEPLIVLLPYIRKELCLALNDSLGITNPGGNPPPETGGWGATNLKFKGSFASLVSLEGQPGQMNGCFAGVGANTPPANTYHFFQVLLAR